jgi:hypothetical protein
MGVVLSERRLEELVDDAHRYTVILNERKREKKKMRANEEFISWSDGMDILSQDRHGTVLKIVTAESIDQSRRKHLRLKTHLMLPDWPRMNQSSDKRHSTTGGRG